MYVYIYIYIYTCLYTYTHTYTYTYTYYMCLSLYINVYTYYMCVCIYIYIYIHILALELPPAARPGRDKRLCCVVLFICFNERARHTHTMHLPCRSRCNVTVLSRTGTKIDCGESRHFSCTVVTIILITYVSTNRKTPMICQLHM